MAPAEDYPDFDPTQLRDLAAVLPAAQVRDLAQSFRITVASILDQIGQAAAAGDTQSLREQAHDLKGTSGSFGAIRLMHLAQALETRGNDTGPLLEAMRETAARVWAAIDDHLAAAAA